MAFQVGIVGAGTLGFERTRKLATYPDVHIAAVAEPERAARDSFSRTFGAKLAVSDHRRLASDPHLDIIYVCSPPATHSSVAIDCLEGGKHVICEQPMAVTMTQAEEMMVAAMTAGRRLFVALPQRYDPANQEAARIIDANDIGYPFLVLITNIENDYERLNDWHDWKGTWDTAGGGILMQRGSEIMDLLNYFFGDMDAVNAVCTRFAIEPLNKAEDSCLLGIEFVEDVSAEVSITGAARFSAWPDEYTGTAMRTEIYGLDGSIRINNYEPRLIVSTQGNRHKVIPISDIKTDEPTDMDRDFLDAISEDREPFVTVENARDALKAVLASYKASQNKRRVEMIEHL